MLTQRAWAGLILCLCFLLACSTALAAVAGIEVPTGQHSDHPSRKLQASLSLYCNITGPCGRCQAAHLRSEACRLTGHAEKLSCATDSQSPHEVVLHVHRRINTMWQPLHISRGCQPATAGSTATGPDSAAAGAGRASADSPSSGITQHDWAPSSEGGGTDFVSTKEAGSSEGGSSEAEPRLHQVYLSGTRRSGMGPLNVLYFELGMLLLLSGSLPVVYIRKRRFAR